MTSSRGLDTTHLGRACGLGVLAWYDGLNPSVNDYVLNINFGDNPFDEDNSGYWTEEQIVLFSGINPGAMVYPQIYYNNDQVKAWVRLEHNYYLILRGVTSTNGIGDKPGAPALDWDEAWDTLNMALEMDHFYNFLQSSVSSFNYP